MRGALLVGVSVFSMSVFSFCILCSSGLFQIWFFLELLGLSLIPLFFLCPQVNILQSLFSYLVASFLASCFILAGVLSDFYVYSCLLGLLLKFGVFPFYFWVYGVVRHSNWCVVWSLSTYLKIPIFVIYYLFGSGVVMGWVEWTAFLGLIVLSFLFWFCSYDLYSCWCHMMLSSTVVMVVVSFASLELLCYLFAFYLVWATLVLMTIWCCDKVGLLTSYYAFLVCGSVMAFPLSLGIFYKLLSSYCLFSFTFPPFIAWILYSISEQLYFLNLLVNYDLLRSDPSLLLGDV
uniref:NADH dehydrogenase subunit 2 n=1 Tax=Tamerlania zarudnyi TaxID=138578 RepID=A0A894JN25_9TREM|nr:NADH dehydrogenase subunit 2 [Tamerlania zarudnyi]QRV61244.1 NADH dehydrogenase subunit 2 [Tamerlania zarudnyi]